MHVHTQFHAHTCKHVCINIYECACACVHMRACTQYYEANSTDTRIIPAMTKFLQAVHKRMFTTSLGFTWSGARWQDLVLTVHWMLEYYPGGNEQMLWDLAELIYEQGFDWKGYYGKDTFPTDAVAGATLFTHGVNNGQAIKSEGVW